MERSLNSILASTTIRVRKYAAKFRLVDHAGARQCLYLRFLGVKRAAWSAVPKFAAYFRFELLEVRGKPRSTNQAPTLRFRDLRFCYQNLVCARLVPIFPRTSGNRVFRFRCLGSRCALSSRENQRSSRPCMHFLV